eukprot:8371196-Pyramimonas_sp.AAC.1
MTWPGAPATISYFYDCRYYGTKQLDMGFALGEAFGWASQPPSNVVAELAYGGQLKLYSSPSTALFGGLLTWWNIRVHWVCAEECTDLRTTARTLAALP